MLVMTLLSFLAITNAQSLSDRDYRQDARIAHFIAELHSHPWPGPAMIAEPMEWDFNLTPPMKELLAVGSPAQLALLASLSDVDIEDQAICLRGGVGDENSV